MKKILLVLAILILAIPISYAFTFEKDYYIILNDVKVDKVGNFEKVGEFNLIENKIFNNNFCNKYSLIASKGKLKVSVPLEEWITGENHIANFPYSGTMYLNFYECQNINNERSDVSIFNFQFKSQEIDNSEFYSRFVSYKPEYVYFNDIPIKGLINDKLKRYIKNYKIVSLDRNRQLFEFLKINKSGFSYSDDFCKKVGYFIFNEFHPAIFSDVHNEKLCKMGAYSLLKNHFLFINELQGFFISDYGFNENFNFDAALESILVRKLAEKSIYRGYYDMYQKRGKWYSLKLTLFRPFDKSDLYDLQSKNINIQIPELINLLSNINDNLRVSEFSELAITRIDRKNEMLAWFSIIIGLIGGITIAALFKFLFSIRIRFENKRLKIRRKK